MQNSYIEFRIKDASRFDFLCNVFQALREAKKTDNFQNDDYWLAFFDKEALSHFWWPTPAEVEEHNRLWFSTPVPQRFTDPALETPWDFGSMIDAFRNGYYELLQCTQVRAGVGRIEFMPYGHPYGGTDCMRALIESFQCEVTA